eukprot:GAFH01003456.1.p1 GENE.GAFH01003456.1~~GAFH01003456.1.p1  ORF type:complete len:187 (-),score=38.04 GAFH01003456.1:288-848(-)
MAEAVAQGAREESVDVQLFQVPELLSDQALQKSGSRAARLQFASIPIATEDDLRDADAIIVGSPTRFGNMCAQMRNFLDGTSRLWLSGALVGCVGAAFTCSATQHGGQEVTLQSIHASLLHHGMVLCGLPFTEEKLLTTSEISGGCPLGPTSIAGPDGTREPSPAELALCASLGRRVAALTKQLRA